MGIKDVHFGVNRNLAIYLPNQSMCVVRPFENKSSGLECSARCDETLSSDG